MVQKKKETYGFFLVAAGLLIGFFLGAGIIYLVNNRPEEQQFTDAALERIARIFQPAEPSSASESIPPAVRARPEHVVSRAPETASLEPGEEPVRAEPLDLQDPPEPAVSETAESLDGNPDVPVAEVNKDEPEFMGSHLIPEESHTRNILNDGIRVRRDRMIGTQTFHLPAIDQLSEGSATTRRLDSLLGNRQSPASRLFTVEFWESPLHFTGYKMGKNRIVLYGLDQIESVSLQAMNDTVYLKYYEFYFPLVLTTEFLPLVAVSDSLIINKLELQWP